MLCVLVIISILAGLLLTSVSAAYAKARRLQREFEGPQFVGSIRERLILYCEEHGTYPARSAQELHDLGVLDSRLMNFLRWREVEFYPFSSADPTNKVVLRVRYSKRDIYQMLKLDLRRMEGE